MSRNPPYGRFCLGSIPTLPEPYWSFGRFFPDAQRPKVNWDALIRAVGRYQEPPRMVEPRVIRTISDQEAVDLYYSDFWGMWRSKPPTRIRREAPPVVMSRADVHLTIDELSRALRRIPGDTHERDMVQSSLQRLQNYMDHAKGDLS